MKSSTVVNVVTYIVAAIVVIVFAFPFYWLITTSFKFDIDIYHYPPVYIPFKFTLHNYWTGLFDLWGLQGIRDSFIISAMNTLLVLALSIPAAYALALMPVRGKSFLLSWILSQRMLPPIAVAIPFFLVWKWLGWLDTYQALVFTYTIFNLPFAIWLLAGYIEELPREIYEAALVDGASHLGVLRSVLLPLIKPSVHGGDPEPNRRPRNPLGSHLRRNPRRPNPGDSDGPPASEAHSKRANPRSD